MNKGNLVIFDFDELYKILRELRNNLNFDIINLALKDKKKFMTTFHPMICSYQKKNTRNRKSKF